MIEPAATTRVHDEPTVRAALRSMEDHEVRRIGHAEELGLPAAGASLGILAAVRAALARLDASTYGSCVACDEPIDAVRLEALPYAERCLPCQAGAEHANG